MADRDLGLQFFDAVPGFRSPPSGAPQQGTLFQQPKPTEEHRWPKGYSPERSAAVDSWLTVHGAQKKMAGVPVQSHEVADAIKRSSMPSSPGGDDPILMMGVGEKDKTAGGRYFPGGNVSRVYSGNPDTKRTDAEMTALHELGHHFSWSAQTEHSGGNRYTPERRGREEAYADDFMVKHYVPRRQDAGTAAADPARHTSYGYESPGSWSEDYTESPAASHSAYMGARTTLPAAASPRSWSAQPYQQHLFQRTANMVNTQTEKDYGQWELTHGSSGEHPLDTIKLGRGVPPRAERMQPGIPRELTPDVIDENREVPDYKGLGARHGMSSMDAYQRYGSPGGVEAAVDDWKAGKLRG